MDNRKKEFRKSAPALSKGILKSSITKKDVLISTSKLDADLSIDPITREIIRHPVVINPDKRVFEALTVLTLFERGGCSAILRGEEITSVVYALPLKNTLDNIFGEDGNRHFDYEVEPVLEQINNWLETYKKEPADLRTQQELDEPFHENDENNNDTEEEPPRPLFFIGTNLLGYPSFFNRPCTNMAINIFVLLECLCFLVSMPNVYSEISSGRNNFNNSLLFHHDAVTVNILIASALGFISATFDGCDIIPPTPRRN